MYNVNYVCVIYVLSFFETMQNNWLKLIILVMKEIVKVVKLLIVLYYFFFIINGCFLIMFLQLQMYVVWYVWRQTNKVVDNIVRASLFDLVFTFFMMYQLLCINWFRMRWLILLLLKKCSNSLKNIFWYFLLI